MYMRAVVKGANEQAIVPFDGCGRVRLGGATISEAYCLVRLYRPSPILPALHAAFPLLPSLSLPFSGQRSKKTNSVSPVFNQTDGSSSATTELANILPWLQNSFRTQAPAIPSLRTATLTLSRIG